jgi:hypothetical protein
LLARGARAPDALRRGHKDQIMLAVDELCRQLRIRALAGGGSVLMAQGLISPVVSPTVSFVVDPASITHLVKALAERGWRPARTRRGMRILPSMTILLVNDELTAGLSLFSVIPGFFADPEETFDLLWEAHGRLRLRGATIPALGRLATAVLASHDGLDGRLPRAASSFDFFVDQFSRVLTDEERAQLVAFVRQVGGCAEMSDLLHALGVEPCVFQLPSEAYARWRLQTEGVSDQLRRAVALIELPPRGRRLLYASGSGRPRSLADVGRMLTSLPGTLRGIFGARRRWAARGLGA